MSEKRIEFKTALLAKEKGLPQSECPSYLLVPFQECTSLDIIDHDAAKLGYGDLIGYYLPDKTVNAPTKSELAEYLRENHSIYVTALPYRDEDTELCWYYSLVEDSEELNDILCDEIDLGTSDDFYDSFNEAFEVGLFEALKLINE